MVSFCEVSFAVRWAYWIRVDRGTLSFEGVGADISAGRFRRLVEGDGCVSAMAGISSVEAKSGLWCFASEEHLGSAF